MTVKPKVFVVGSGIIVASVALACRDPWGQGHCFGTGIIRWNSQCQFFWLDYASFTENQAYFYLRKMALASFRALRNRLVLVDYMRWQGTLWWEDKGYDLPERFGSSNPHVYPTSVLHKEQIKLLETYLLQVPRQAILTATEGAAEAQKVALVVLAEVERNGC